MSDFIPKAGEGLKIGGLGRKAQKLQAMREKAAQGKSGAKPQAAVSTAAVVQGEGCVCWVEEDELSAQGDVEACRASAWRQGTECHAAKRS